MHVEITFMEAISLIAMLMGGVWALLKYNAVQFSRGLDQRFTAMGAAMELRAKVQDEKLNHIDPLLASLARIELDTERRHSAYLEKFSTKDELNKHSERFEKTVNEMFTLLRAIDEKLGRKVDREDCKSCRNSQ